VLDGNRIALYKRIVRVRWVVCGNGGDYLISLSTPQSTTTTTEVSANVDDDLGPSQRPARPDICPQTPAPPKNYHC